MYRRASDFPQYLRHCDAAHMQDVPEIPVGTFVLVLSRTFADLGWAPVVFDEQHFGDHRIGCFTYVHPDCLQYFSPLHDDAALIGRAGWRNKSRPTQDLGDRFFGVRRINGLLIRDARWYGSQSSGVYKGYCYSVVSSMARVPLV